MHCGRRISTFSHNYEEKFRRLVVNTSAERASPHKICVLLTVLNWHVIHARDSQIPDFAVLVSLERKLILLPRAPRHAPELESLK